MQSLERLILIISVFFVYFSQNSGLNRPPYVSINYSNTVEIQSNFRKFDNIMPIRNNLLKRKEDDLIQNSAKNKQKTQKLL